LHQHHYPLISKIPLELTCDYHPHKRKVLIFLGLLLPTE